MNSRKSLWNGETDGVTRAVNVTSLRREHIFIVYVESAIRINRERPMFHYLSLSSVQFVNIPINHTNFSFQIEIFRHTRTIMLLVLLFDYEVRMRIFHSTQRINRGIPVSSRSSLVLWSSMFVRNILSHYKMTRSLTIHWVLRSLLPTISLNAISLASINLFSCKTCNVICSVPFPNHLLDCYLVTIHFVSSEYLLFHIFLPFVCLSQKFGGPDSKSFLRAIIDEAFDAIPRLHHIKLKRISDVVNHSDAITG